ncbi:MAG TPA: hypothetical protein VK459_05325, partial [Polyangiaceae bacterium]|nr:hypothetical protein [Polyangiaceae bacterium]
MSATPAIEAKFKNIDLAPEIRGADGDLGIGLSSVVTRADALPPRPLQFFSSGRRAAHLRGSTTITPRTMFI